jgi:putative DNA primase/helicase
MPGELFGDAWPLLQLIAAGTASPVDYPAIAFLASCASLIGGKRRVRPYATSVWSEPCILWCGAVGDPSSRKSPPLEQVTERLR